MTDLVTVWTDGSSLGNPGPSGYGFVVMCRGQMREGSGYMGEATNNQAELRAILEGLKAAKHFVQKTDLPVLVRTDSKYAIGVCARDWRPKKNKELVRDIKKVIRGLPVDVEFEYVKGHSGVAGNERCDELARAEAMKGKWG